MPTEFTPAPPRRSQTGFAILLLVVALGGIYAGMRWHTTFERLLVGSAAGVSVDATTSAPSGEKQLWTCGMHPQVIQDHPGDCPICHMKLTPLVTGDASANDAKSGSGSVLIDPSVVQNMGVRLADVVEAPLRHTVRASAIVDEVEPSHRDVNLRVAGWIQRLYANTDGMEIGKGDPLFDLYSPELRLAIEELIAARRAAAATMGEANGVAHDASDSMVAAAESRLVALDLTLEQIREFGAMDSAPNVVTIVSPLAGHVTEKADVYDGSSVMAGQRVLRLAQRTKMWVEGRVPEGELARVHVGQKARAMVDAYPGRTFDGEVSFIHPHFDEMTRTGMVRMELSNLDHALHQGMYATIEIDVGNDARATLVPREAIIDSGLSQIVFVSAGKGRFEPRRVTIGLAGDGGLVQVLSGLAPGEQVVASGQFLLDSESRLREAIAKFLGDTPATAPAAMAPAPAVAPMNDVAPAKVDAIVAAYLPLAESLGATQTSDAPLQMDAIIAAIHAVHGDVTLPERIRLVTTAASAAEAMKGKPLGEQRELFKTLSRAVITLVDAMPPSPSVAGSLYVVNCPMAKADWLQKSREIANPYYAEEMKACGAVVRPVGAKGVK